VAEGWVITAFISVGDSGIAQEIRFARMLHMWYARGRESREGWANLEAFQPPRQAFTHAAGTPDTHQYNGWVLLKSASSR